MKKFIRAISVCASLFLASNASGALITANGMQVDTLDLTQGFTSFYNFGNGNTFSANTGLEVANSATAFIASNAGELALFVIFSGPGGDAGSTNFDITGTEGAISFVDEAFSDTVIGNNVQFNYVAGKTDGLVFSGLTSDNWFVSLDFNNFFGFDSISFLTFDNAGQSSVLFSSLAADGLQVESTASSNAINAPTTFSLVLALGVLALRRRAK